MREKVLGYGEYPDDVEMEGMVYASAVRPSIRGQGFWILTAGRQRPFPACWLCSRPRMSPITKVGHLQQDWDVMIAKGDITRCVGDAICLVVAESRDILEKAKADGED